MTLRTLVIAAALAFAAPAFAQEGMNVQEASKAAVEYGDGAAGEREHSGEVKEGIENWWSFDYGEKTKDPTHKGWPPPFGWALVNFVVFLGILSRLLWKPLKLGWETRHDQVKKELAEATRLRKEAEAKLAEYAKKVSHVDEEVDTLMQQLRRDAEADRARIIANAETEAARLKVEADRQINVEIERARAELRKETVAAALKAAEEILKSRINADDQKRLAEQYVASVESRPVGGGAS